MSFNVRKGPQKYFRYFKSGLRSRSRDRSWSRLESTVLAGVGVEAGVGQIVSTLTPTRSRRLTPGNRRCLWTNGYASPENNERQEEKETVSLRLKLNHNLGIEIRLIDGIRNKCRVISIIV